MRLNAMFYIKSKIMKRTVLIFIGIIFMTFACNSDDENSQPELMENMSEFSNRKEILLIVN